MREQAKRAGQWVRPDQLTLDANRPVGSYLESVAFPLLLIQHGFVNADGRTAIHYLVSSDTPLTADQMTPIYRTRWTVEPYHKSLKQNASRQNSPTQTVITQSNHRFASLCASIKLEWVRKTTKLIPWAL